MPNDYYYRAFWLGGSFDRPERPQIWSQTSPRGDSRWCASGFGHRGSSLQWYIVPRAACHICEPKRPVSWYLAHEDYYGRGSAWSCYNPTYRARYLKGPGETLEKEALEQICSKLFEIAFVLVRLDHV